jgi:hypothetical protein
MWEIACIGLIALLAAASLGLIAACGALGGEKP